MPQTFKDILEMPMSEPKIEVEMFECFVCDKAIAVKRLTGPSDDSPEMFQPPEGAWMGDMLFESEDNPDEDDVKAIATCSLECTQKMLAEFESEEEP